MVIVSPLSMVVPLPNGLFMDYKNGGYQPLPKWDDPPNNLLSFWEKWRRSIQSSKLLSSYLSTELRWSFLRHEEMEEKTQNRGSSGTKNLGKFPWFEKPRVSWLRMEAEIWIPEEESQESWVFWSRWMNQPHQPIASCWLNQPIWKNMLVKLVHSPGGVKIKNVWKHNLDRFS